MSWGNWIRKGNLFDWDFVYGEIPNKLVPFDYEALFNATCNFVIGVTNAETGEAEFLSSKQMDKQQLLAAITASSSLPFVSKMAKLNGGTFMDGGLSDSIPIGQALASGYDIAVVVLTRNEGYQKEATKLQWLIKLIYKRYPKLVESIISRADHYNKTLEELEQLEERLALFFHLPQPGH